MRDASTEMDIEDATFCTSVQNDGVVTPPETLIEGMQRTRET